VCVGTKDSSAVHFVHHRQIQGFQKFQGKVLQMTNWKQTVVVATSGNCFGRAAG